MVASAVIPTAFVLAGPFDRATTKLETAAGVTGADLGPAGDLTVIIGRIINVVLSFCGIILLCYFIYAGFLWMTASGDSKKVDKAKDILKNAIIGMLVLVTSYALSSYVLSALTAVTTGANTAGSAKG